MSSTEQWVKPRRLMDIKPGCAIRSVQFPHLIGVYRGDGHGMAVIRMDCMQRDALCKLSDIEIRVEGEQ